MIRPLAALAPLAFAAIVSAAGRQTNARACRFPTERLANARDTAAWCAREFVIRNGYTEAPASAIRDDIALEPGTDVGLGFESAIANRHNTVSPAPLRVCETGTGYLVSFKMPNQLNMLAGKGVVMNGHFMGLALLQPLVSIDPSVSSPLCSVPRLP
jgi:hypothetical protein